MIVKNYTAKKCDICKRTLAEKRGLFYRNVYEYYTLRKDERWNENQPAHICLDCWDKMKSQFVDILGRYIK